MGETKAKMPYKTYSYSLETEIPPAYTQNLMDFLHREYVQSQKRPFMDVTRGVTDGEPSISFVVPDQMDRRILSVEVRGSNPAKLKITKLDDSVPEEKVEEVRQDITIVVDLFEENVTKSTIFFAWREGEAVLPEKLRGRENQPINRIFLETQILLFLVLIVGSIFLFQVAGSIAPFLLLAIQFVFVFYSNKIVSRAADWRITERNPTIHLLEYHAPWEEHEQFNKKFPKEKLAELKKAVYEQTIAKKGEIDSETVHQIFLRNGIECKPENLTTKKVNVYDLVKRTAGKFGFPTPEVVVSNSIIPNASASGPSPGRGIVLITTGLLVHLKDEEIISVLGHEFGHLKARDPLLLFGLTAIQYLLLFYVLWNFLAASPFLFFLYYYVVMTAIFFVAKFFEARADLLSAIVIGQPQVLATALERIGFKRLLYERVPSYRVQEWISLEPHPPIYFRINRLGSIKIPVNISHPLLQSIKDVMQGFIKSL